MSIVNEEIWNILKTLNIVFVNDIPERYKCIICNQVLKRPMQTTCGCQGCYNCIYDYLKDDIKSCPSNQPDCDGIKLEFNKDVFLDQAANKEIMKMMVKCPLTDCPEQDCLRNIGTHMKECKFRKVQCEKCNEMYAMCYKSKHNTKICPERYVICKWCNVSMTCRTLNDQHLNIDSADKLCSKYYDICPNKCITNEGKPVLIKIHLMECKNKREECPYQCGEPLLTLNDLQLHLEETKKDHSIILCKFIEKVKMEHQNLKDEISRIRKEANEERNNDESVKQTLKSFEDNINELRINIGSCEKSDGSLKGPAVSIFHGASYIWRINNYSVKRSDAAFGSGSQFSMTSDPFYTSEFGYKMCLRVYPAGDGVGRNTHLSVFFAIMKGDYDDLLSWPFKQKVTLSLLEHDGNSKHHSDTFKPDVRSACYHKPTGDCNIASGSPKFIQLSSLESPSTFCKNDTIYIKISVDVIGISRP